MSDDALRGDSFHPLTRDEWRDWLAEHHTRDEGVWLVTFKKATGKPRIEYDEAVEEALCFGWIDNIPRKLDDERSLLWFAPRKPGSGWSRPNKERIERRPCRPSWDDGGVPKRMPARGVGPLRQTIVHPFPHFRKDPFAKLTIFRTLEKPLREIDH